MTPDQLEQWCRENGTAPQQRILGNQRPGDAGRASEGTAGAIVKALTSAGIDDKLSMSKREAIAKMQSGLSAYAEREKRRMGVANYRLEPTKDGEKIKAPDYATMETTELPDRVGLDGVNLVMPNTSRW